MYHSRIVKQKSDIAIWDTYGQTRPLECRGCPWWAADIKRPLIQIIVAALRLLACQTYNIYYKELIS